MADPPVDLPEPILPPEVPDPSAPPTLAPGAGILRVQPGSNAIIAVARKTDIRDAQKLMLLADALSAAIGQPQEYVGDRLGYSLWTIGPARPVTLRVLGSTKKLVEWYRSKPDPIIDEPEFFSVNLDWRGPTTDLQWPGGMFSLPDASSAVHGADNWPDMTTEEYAQALREAKANEAITRAGRQVEEHVGGTLGLSVVSIVKWAAIGLGVAGGLVLVAKLATMKRSRD